MKVKGLLMLCVVLSLSMTTVVKAESQEYPELNEKWINNEKHSIEMFVNDKPTGFRIIRNYKSNEYSGEAFQLIDTDGRVINCDNGFVFCKEQARIKYQDIKNFESTPKLK